MQSTCFIFFRKGTTGSPKGVLLSNHSIVNNAMEMGRRFQMDVKVRLHISEMNIGFLRNILGKD
jgi:long-subunit acyl-CoA synthetase (AMP-forming)